MLHTLGFSKGPTKVGRPGAVTVVFVLQAKCLPGVQVIQYAHLPVDTPQTQKDGRGWRPSKPGGIGDPER